MATIHASRRIRRTQFSDAVEAAGVKSYTVYNHMLLPTVFQNVEADYHHLKRHVQVWDVSVERQVALKGPDARRALQYLTPRDLAKLDQTRCLYAPLCDQGGGIINDPVALQVSDDEYWLSIASSDVLLWALGITGASGLHVDVWEPDVSPLAIQGPQADVLAARIFGDAVTDLGFFRCGRFAWNGHDWLVARSGWSKQGGFEVYVEGSDRGMALWEALFAAGEDLNVRAGCPNAIERIEAGLLSYGSDMTRADTPLQAGLGRYVSDSQLPTCWGGRALSEERAAGSTRQIRPLEIAGRVPPCSATWSVMDGDTQVGYVTSAAWSPDFQVTVAIAMIDQSHWTAGTAVTIATPDGTRDGKIREKFWI